MDQVVSIQKYTLNGGSNTGSGFAQTINELFLWNPGSDCTLGGTGTVNAYVGITFSGAGNKILIARTLNNGNGVAAATATWSAGNIFLDNSAILNNNTNAIFTATGNNSIGANISPGGTFNKTGGTGATDLGITFNNTGTVNVDTGILYIASGTSTGLFEVDSGDRRSRTGHARAAWAHLHRSPWSSSSSAPFSLPPRGDVRGLSR